MRGEATAAKVRAFMNALGAAVRGPGVIYFTGGATALLEGWRKGTVDIDVKLDPEPAGAFEAIARLKETLDLNVETASPDQFIPELPGWRERSPRIAVVGPVEFRHYDFYGQALAKIERGHERDRHDVRAMFKRGKIERERLRELFQAIRKRLDRFPAIDAKAFGDRVEEALRGAARST